MTKLLRYVSLVHFKDHQVRTLLTLGGIVLGVALLVAMQIVNETVFASFTNSLEAIAGDAVLQMTNGQAGVPEQALEKIGKVKGVRRAAGMILTKAYLEDHPEERLQVVGVDFLQDQGIRRYEFREQDVEMEEDPLVVLGQPESILVTETFAQRFHTALDSKMALITPVGRKVFTVRGVLKVAGPMSAFGGDLLVMDLYAAQLVFEKGDRFDQIDIAIQSGEKIDEVAARLTAAVGQYGQVIRPQMRGMQVEAMLGSLRFGLEHSSSLAIFLGLFLVYNTMYISVLQRRREIGLLRCVGASRGQISGLFLGEALVLGAVGSVLGIFAGIWLSRVLLPLLQETMSALLIGVQPTHLSITRTNMLIAMACGLGVSVVATLFPIYQAVRIQPLAALDREARQGVAPGRVRLYAFVGLGLVLVAVCFFILELTLKNVRVGVWSIPFSLLGFSLLTPLFIVKVFPHLARLVGWVSGMTGRLSMDSLVRSPIRNSAAMSAVMVSMAAVFVTSVFLHSLLTSFKNHISQLFQADIMVTAGSMFTGPQNICMSDSLVTQIENLPGVDHTGSFRFLDVIYEGKETFLTGLDLASAARHGTFYMIKGSLDEVGQAAARGEEGVMVTNQFVKVFGKGKGDVLDLVTPSGRKGFPILGEYMDYVSETGGITVDRSVYKKYWRDATVDGIMVFLRPGADLTSVIQELKRRFGKDYGILAVSNREFKEAFLERVSRSFRLTWALKIVLLLLSAMGVMNTLIAMVLDRTREIGLLRALGATRGQTERSVLLEAGILGACGCVFGILLGILGSLRMVKLSLSFLVGWYMEYAVPGTQLTIEIAGAVLICLIAGYYPAWRAGRLPVLQAIAYE